MSLASLTWRIDQNHRALAHALAHRDRFPDLGVLFHTLTVYLLTSYQRNSTMDPAAFALMLKAICDMITTLAAGATPEQKQQMWQWHIDDQARLRKFFHIE